MHFQANGLGSAHLLPENLPLDRLDPLSTRCKDHIQHLCRTVNICCVTVNSWSLNVPFPGPPLSQAPEDALVIAWLRVKMQTFASGGSRFPVFAAGRLVVRKGLSC